MICGFPALEVAKVRVLGADSGDEIKKSSAEQGSQ